MIRLAVRVARADAEVVLAELLELVPSGLEERDAGPDAIEYVIYGAPGEVPDLGDLHAAAGSALVDVSTSEVPDDWAERWKVWHRPVDVAWRFKRLRVRPPWEPPLDGDGLELVIDPGQAFGTGSHATTRLTLELLSELEPAGALADWGCGSGVLAVCAAKLGWAPVSACDIELASVAATQEAARANGVSVEATRCDVRRGGPWAPTVLANLVRPLLLEVAAALERPPERMIVSGLQTDEAAEVVAAFGRHGLREAARKDGDGWAAVRLEGERGETARGGGARGEPERGEAGRGEGARGEHERRETAGGAGGAAGGGG
jgi:ribosomal protein L11 methyltransferase